MRFESMALPNAETAAEASEAARQLASLLTGRESRVSLTASDRQEEAVLVPVEAFRLLVQILVEMANGNAVAVLPVQRELTTQQAADLLNVSRPYLVQLLEAGRIPFRRVGTRRRIRVEDLLRYRQVDDARRDKVLDELTKEAERLGLGY